MTTNLPLEEGDEHLCSHRRWHPVTALHTQGTNYTLQMLYFGVARAECLTRGSAAYLVGIRRGNRVEISSSTRR